MRTPKIQQQQPNKVIVSLTFWVSVFLCQGKVSQQVLWDNVDSNSAFLGKLQFVHLTRGKFFPQYVDFFFTRFSNSGYVNIKILQKLICTKIFPHTRRMQFWQPCRTFFTHDSKKNNYKVYSKHFFPKCSYGQVECSLAKPTEKVWLKVRKFFVQNPKEIKMFRFQVLVGKVSSGHVECSFGTPDKNFFLEVRQFFAESAKKVGTHSLFQTFFLETSLWTCRRQL